jgi:hypothetical protein
MSKQTTAYVQSYAKIRLRTLPNTSKIQAGIGYAKIRLSTLPNTERHVCQNIVMHTPKHMQAYAKVQQRILQITSRYTPQWSTLFQPLQYTK